MEESKDKKRTITVFTVNGISSLLGWNVVLAALDFFQDSFSDYDIYSFLSIPLFVGYLLVGSSYHVLSNHFHYIQLIRIGNLITSVCLLCMLLTSLLISQSLFGYILLLIESLLIGIGSNLSQLTFFAMINYFSQKVVSWFTVGTALSGLFVTSLRMIILAIAGAESKSKIPIILYFVLAIIFSLLDIVMNIIFCKSKEYKKRVDKFLVHHDEELNNAPEEEKPKLEVIDSLNVEVDQSETTQPVSENFIQEEERIQNQNYFTTLLETQKQIRPYPWIILFTFVITFTSLTGPMLSRNVKDLVSAWSSVIYLISYNIGDTLGKYLAEVHNIFNKKSLFYVFFSRLFFFYTVSVIATGIGDGDPLINNYIFPYFNMFLFAFTNGFCINASFIMAFKVCPLLYKKYAGVMCGLMLQLGIIGGNILQIPYARILGIS